MKHEISYDEIKRIKRKVTIELKPCPFCGGTPVFREAGFKNPYFGVKCTGCKAQLPLKGGPEGQLKASELWNERVES